MTRPQVFLAPQLETARRNAWNCLAAARFDPLHPPLVFTRARAFSSWRTLARASQSGANACFLPRLSGASAWFARFHGANTRAVSLSGADRLWLLSALVRAHGDQFPVLRLSDEPHFLSDLAGLIARMRRAACAQLPANGDLWLGAWNEWMQLYDEALASRRAFDFEAAPALFGAFAAQNRAFAWPQSLVVDDYLELAPALRLGLRALVERAARVAVVLPCPGDSNDPALAPALDFWRELGAEIHQENVPMTPRVAAARWLCDAEKPAPAAPLPPRVTLTTDHTTWDELNRIAAQVRRSLDGGARPRDFCVVAPRSAPECEIRGAFAAHGVPLDWPETPDWPASPLVARLLRALNPPREGFDVHALHDLFGDGALQLAIDETRFFDARRVRRAVLALRGEDLLAPWRDETAFGERLERAIEAWLGAKARENADKLAAATSLLEAGDLGALARFKTLLAPLENRLDAATWAATCDALITALTAHWRDESDVGTDSHHATSGDFSAAAMNANGGDLDARLTNSGAEFDGASRAIARAAIEALRAAIEAVAARARIGSENDDSGGATRRAASGWLAWLRLELAAPAPATRPQRAREGVRFLEIETAGEAFGDGETTVFLVALSERAWPRPTPKTDFGARAQVALKVVEQGAISPLARATHDLARLLAHEGALHLSRANWVEGRESEASPLWDDLRALWPASSRWPALETPRSAPPTSRALWLAQWNRAPESAPEALQIAARLRSERAHGREIGVFDGVLGARGAAMLAQKNAQNAVESGKTTVGTVFSPSALELYARCPLAYFFGRVLELRGDSARGDDLDAAESGSLMHAILFRFRHEWSTPLSGAVFEQAREFLAQITRAACDELALPPILRAAEARRLIGVPSRPGALVRWLAGECAQGDAPDGQGAWVTRLFPLVHLAAGNIQSAGRDATFWALHDGQRGLEHRFQITVRGVEISGILDRLDVAADGSLAAVIDYKTGAPTSLPDLSSGDDGLHFQLALYLLGAAHIFRGHPASPRLAATYGVLRAGEFRGGIGQLETGARQKKFRSLGDTQWHNWLDDVAQRVERIAALIRAGTFNLSLQNAKTAGCEFCDHRQLCGQNPTTQSARAAHFDGSDEFYLPARYEFDAP